MVTVRVRPVSRTLSRVCVAGAVFSCLLALGQPRVTQGPQCPAGKKRALEIPRIPCGRDYASSSFLCLSKEDIAKYYYQLPASPDVDAILIVKRPRPESELRSATSSATSRQAIACCEVDEQCGYRGHCDCMAGTSDCNSGLCRYGEKQYSDLLNRLRRLIRDCKRWEDCQDYRFQLDVLIERDSKRRPAVPPEN